MISEEKRCTCRREMVINGVPTHLVVPYPEEIITRRTLKNIFLPAEIPSVRNIRGTAPSKVEWIYTTVFNYTHVRLYIGLCCFPQQIVQFKVSL